MDAQLQALRAIAHNTRWIALGVWMLVIIAVFALA
jgi:hypothetical protein